GEGNAESTHRRRQRVRGCGAGRTPHAGWRAVVLPEVLSQLAGGADSVDAGPTGRIRHARRLGRRAIHLRALLIPAHRGPRYFLCCFFSAARGAIVSAVRRRGSDSTPAYSSAERKALGGRSD